MLVQKISWTVLLLLLCQNGKNGVEAIRVVVCEGGIMLLYCNSGLIQVTEANYGRTDRTTCSFFIADSMTSNMYCFQKSAFQIMSHRCDARKRCYVPALNTIFSDPCAWTYKYLDVRYHCI
ncbi:L-rhamnose-binding lectin CSL3-like [Puntigrus tetrazona]|uniref:L-rhamnose-binding lectin CSL3-like n=1 Tax=Puntigrus tetrazona TaxID=1606681 RepID=UPI001C88EAC4|nr:L-rhamnose-binding lectin CSL3-like [Puntigrus tetrazona]